VEVRLPYNGSNTCELTELFLTMNRITWGASYKQFFFISLERTTTSVRMEALGVAMAAGQAEGIGVWDIYKEPRTPVSHDVFLPSTTREGEIVQDAS
jgi:hypothetical protein